jgi:uncharacterized protein (TIGR00369 family)
MLRNIGFVSLVSLIGYEANITAELANSAFFMPIRILISPKLIIFVQFKKHITMQLTKEDFHTRIEPDTMIQNLGIQILDWDEEGVIRAEMPVDSRTRQHYGVLCGGATLALAEIIAGLGSIRLCADDEIPRGIQVSGNHVGAVPEGSKVIAEGRILHRGRTTHVWDVNVTNPEGRLVSTVRVTNFILKKS